MRRTTLIAVMLAAVLALAGCGEKKDVKAASASGAQSLNLMLDWEPNADHVGIYEALAKGYFTAAGLDVHVRIPGDPATPLGLLEAGKVDVAVSYEPQLMLARAQGAPLVAIAALTQEPLTSLVSLGKDHISSPRQLRGKTVGDAGIPYQRAFLSTILNHAGVSPGSVHEVNVGANLVPAMLSGRVNATLGAYWNYEAIQLRQAGRRVNAEPVSTLGVPNYNELVLVTTESEVASHTNELRRFVQAVGRGYTATRDDPQGAVQVLVRANPSLSTKLQLASVRATLPAYFPRRSGLPWGWQDPTQWNQFAQWMAAQHLVSNLGALADTETNQLLAGQGP